MCHGSNHAPQAPWVIVFQIKSSMIKQGTFHDALKDLGLQGDDMSKINDRIEVQKSFTGTYLVDGQTFGFTSDDGISPVLLQSLAGGFTPSSGEYNVSHAVEGEGLRADIEKVCKLPAMPVAAELVMEAGASEDDPIDLHAPLTVAECKAMFELFDKDCNGSLDQLEVVQMIKIIKGSDQVNAVKIMQAWDKDQNGQVSVDEFQERMLQIAADKPSWVPRIREMVAHTKLQSVLSEALSELFSAFDVDNNGVLDLEEIKLLVATCIQSVNEHPPMSPKQTANDEVEGLGKLCDVLKGLQMRCEKSGGSTINKDDFLAALKKAEDDLPDKSQEEEDAKRRWVQCIHAKARALASNAPQTSKQQMPVSIKAVEQVEEKEERKCGCLIQ